MGGTPRRTHECELCLRQVSRITRHHLIPKTRHKNKRTRRRHDREERTTRIAMLCRPCHSNIHAHFTEKELADELNTIALLRERPEIQAFTEFMAGKPDGFRVRHKTAGRKRR